jgi:SAM-dependent methyltransferase
MTSYRAFAPFYDAVQGDGSEHAAFLRKLIEGHRPKSRTVLELACGTGSILKQLQSDYEVTGLDLSAPMLEVAAEKVPGVHLIEADMTRFALGTRFDVVLCVYDSINHLLEFSQWQDVFARAHEHLTDGGIFVFDINTERRLATLCARPPLVQWFGDGHLLVMDVDEGPAGAVVWGIRLFEHKDGGRYLLHSEDILEVSFPRSQVEQGLRERFRRVSAHDSGRKRPTTTSERIHFVAVK